MANVGVSIENFSLQLTVEVPFLVHKTSNLPSLRASCVPRKSAETRQRWRLKTSLNVGRIATRSLDSRGSLSTRSSHLGSRMDSEPSASRLARACRYRNRSASRAESSAGEIDRRRRGARSAESLILIGPRRRPKEAMDRIGTPQVKFDAAAQSAQTDFRRVGNPVQPDRPLR